MNLRGFRSRHVILLLNGIPLNSTFDGQFDPSLIPVENIAKIKVSYGNHSALYGQGGLGGVINIITKEGTKGIQGMFSAEVGQKDTHLGRFSFSGAREKANFFLSGSLFGTDGFRLSDDFEATSLEDGDLRENRDKKRKNFFANVGLNGDDWQMGLVLNYLKGKFGVPPSTIDDRADVFANRPKFERVEDFEGISGQLSVSHDLAGPLGMRGWVFMNRISEQKNRYENNSYESMDDPTVKGTFEAYSTSWIKGGTLQTKAELESAGQLTLGFTAEKHEYESTGTIRDVTVTVPGGGNNGGGGRSGGVSRSNTYEVRPFGSNNGLSIYSASIEYEVLPIEKLGLVSAYSHHWFKKSAVGADSDGDFLVGGYYDLSDTTRLRGSVARKIRFPSLRQLYEEDGGNPDLTSEKSYNYEVGFEQKLPRNSALSLIGFKADVSDYIEKIPPEDRFQNNDKYRFEGVELTGQTRPLEELLLRAGYTYMKTKDQSPGAEKDQLQYRPRQKLTVEVGYSFVFGFSAYVNLLHVSDQVYYSRKLPLSARKLDDYTLVNLKLDQTLLPGLRLYFGADNLLDEDYEESYAFPQAGRSLYGGLLILPDRWR
jgi:outer membrane receptor protein involved in Fe transport